MRRLAAAATVALAIAATTLATARPAAAAPTTVCVVPLGKFDAKLVPIIQRGIAYIYGFQTRLLPARAMPAAAFYKPRKRWRADEILSFLNASVLPDSGCTIVMGFTREDISTTKPPFEDWGILGLGQIGGTASVVSSFRASRRVGRKQAAMRTVKVVNHELGHVLGMDHGGEPGCVMNDAAGTVKTIDKEPGLLCPNERSFVEDHHEVVIPAHTSFEWPLVLSP